MENIYKKLQEIKVFDPEFKQLIFDKLTLLPLEKIQEIDRLLSEVLSWEEGKKQEQAENISNMSEESHRKDLEKIEEIKKLISNL